VRPARWDGDDKLAVIAIDVNSSHGLYLMAFIFDGSARLVAQHVFKPPSTALLRLLAVVMSSYSRLGSWEPAVKRFRRRRDVEELQGGGRGSAVEALKLAEKPAPPAFHEAKAVRG